MQFPRSTSARRFPFPLQRHAQRHASKAVSVIHTVGRAFFCSCCGTKPAKQRHCRAMEASSISHVSGSRGRRRQPKASANEQQRGQIPPRSTPPTPNATPSPYHSLTPILKYGAFQPLPPVSPTPPRRRPPARMGLSADTMCNWPVTVGVATPSSPRAAASVELFFRSTSAWRGA